MKIASSIALIVIINIMGAIYVLKKTDSTYLFLSSAKNSYYIGCMQQGGSHDQCKDKSIEYIKKIIMVMGAEDDYKI